MKISREQFLSTGSDLKMPKEQLNAFWSALEKSSLTETTPFAKYLFYFGALIVISAMTWFMSLSWEIFGGGGIFIIATLYAIVLTIVGALLWNKKDLRIPSGLLITIAVCMVPLAVYGLESYFHLWPEDDSHEHYQDFYNLVAGRWVFMELATIVAGVVALWYFPFPFLTAPIFFAAWFLAMDIVPLFFGKEATFDQKCWISLIFGLVLLVIGLFTDRRQKRDYAFWSYFFGTLSFWGGLNCLVWDKGEGLLFLYFILNLLMMFFSILVKRNVLMVFGAIGAFAYLGHLAYDLFEDYVFFPFALSFVGLAVIYLGVLYQRNAQRISKAIFGLLPTSIRSFFEGL